MATKKWNASSLDRFPGLAGLSTRARNCLLCEGVHSRADAAAYFDDRWLKPSAWPPYMGKGTVEEVAKWLGVDLASIALQDRNRALVIRINSYAEVTIRQLDVLDRAISEGVTLRKEDSARMLELLEAIQQRMQRFSGAGE